MFTFMFVCLGQHDDARMCIAIAMTAARLGAQVTNYVEVLELTHGKDASGKEVVNGAKVLDKVTGKRLGGGMKK